MKHCLNLEMIFWIEWTIWCCEQSIWVLFMAYFLIRNFRLIKYFRCFKCLNVKTLLFIYLIWTIFKCATSLLQQFVPPDWLRMKNQERDKNGEKRKNKNIERKKERSKYRGIFRKRLLVTISSILFYLFFNF